MNRETRKLVLRMNSHRLARDPRAISAATITPARTPGVAAAWATSRIAATNRTVRHASPTSNLRLNSMLFHAAVKRSAAEPKLGGRERHIEVVHAKCPFDHLLFVLIKIKSLAGDRHRPRGQ